MNALRKLILTALSVFLPLVCYGAYAQIDDIFYKLDESSQTAEVISLYGVDSTGGVTIPSSVVWEGVSYTVTSIGGDFCRLGGMVSVTIPHTVTNIADEAFLGCDLLVSIIVEGSNPVYDSRDNCNAIIETATNTLIAGCTNTSIPGTVTRIGKCAFAFYSDLSSITIPNSVTSIGESAFYYCPRLTSVTIPNSVTSIGVSAFGGCSGLTSVTIPNSVTSIGASAFEGCSGLTSVTIPSSVTSIEKRTFAACYSLTSITLPNSITSIKYAAFWDCSSLGSIAFPNSLKSIEDEAFL